jgi:hypothetical protein
VLQKSAAPRPIAKNGFLNQNSLFGLDLEKVFFAPWLKIVLQHYRPVAEVEPLICCSAQSRSSFKEVVVTAFRLQGKHAAGASA